MSKYQKMFLIEPSMEYDEQIQVFRKEFLACEGSMDGCGSLRRFDMTQDWLEQVESLRHPETVPPGLVPSTQYIYVRESDSKMVGVIQIRHCFNEFCLLIWMRNNMSGLCFGGTSRRYCCHLMRRRELGRP